MRIVILVAFGAMLLVLPGCAGKNLTLAQQQQITLSGFEQALTTADQLAITCITDGVPLCVMNKVEIKKQALKLAFDTTQAQAVITAGADASSNLSAIQAELAVMAGLIPSQSGKT